MRNTKAHDTKAHASWRTLGRIGRLTAIALGVGLVMAAGPVRAADDEEDDEKTFEEKVIEGIMRGIGGTNMENRGIDYRERSPLVVPPKLDLPPPAGTSAVERTKIAPLCPVTSHRTASIAVPLLGLRKP